MKGKNAPIWVIAICAVLLTLGGLAFMFGGAGTSGNITDAINQKVNTGTGLACSENGADISMALKFVNTSANNQKESVNTNAYLYIKDGAGNWVLTQNTTSGTSGVATFTDVGCGKTVKIIAGDGGSTRLYYGATEEFVTKDDVTTSELVLQESGAATLKFRSPQNTAQQNTLTYNLTLNSKSAGDTASDIEMLVKQPDKGRLMGDGGFAVCYRYNGGNFSKIAPGSYVDEVNIEHIPANGTLANIDCYNMQDLASTETEAYAIVMDQKPGILANNTYVDVLIVDKTTDRFNGNLVVGYDTASGTDADIGRTDVTTTGAVTIIS